MRLSVGFAGFFILITAVTGASLNTALFSAADQIDSDRGFSTDQQAAESELRLDEIRYVNFTESDTPTLTLVFTNTGTRTIKDANQTLDILFNNSRRTPDAGQVFVSDAGLTNRTPLTVEPSESVVVCYGLTETIPQSVTSVTEFGSQQSFPVELPRFDTFDTDAVNTTQNGEYVNSNVQADDCPFFGPQT